MVRRDWGSQFSDPERYRCVRPRATVIDHVLGVTMWVTGFVVGTMSLASAAVGDKHDLMRLICSIASEDGCLLALGGNAGFEWDSSTGGESR